MAADADKEPSNDFDPISDVYEEMVAWAPYGKWVRDLAQRLRRHRLRRGGPVLDAACGTGLSTFPWAESGYRVLGVDRSEPMLALARAKLAGRDLPIRFERSDLLQLDLPGSFDLAVCMHSGLDYILNLERLARAFRCLRSTLRPGGLLAFDKCLDEPGFYREPYSNARPITNGVDRSTFRSHGNPANERALCWNIYSFVPTMRAWWTASVSSAALSTDSGKLILGTRNGFSWTNPSAYCVPENHPALPRVTSIRFCANSGVCPWET